MATEENPDAVPFLKRTLTKLNKGIGNKVQMEQPEAFVYQLDLPDDVTPKLLDWDPVSPPMRTAGNRSATAAATR